MNAGGFARIALAGLVAALSFHQGAAHALPFTWPVQEIQDPTTLGLEVLNEKDGVPGTPWTLVEADGVTIRGQYRLYVVRFNGQPSGDPQNPYEKIYALVAAPADAQGAVIEGGSPPALVQLHGYPQGFPTSAGHVNRFLNRVADIQGWGIAINAPGHGILRSSGTAHCAVPGRLAKYGQGGNYAAYVNDPSFELLGVRADVCHLVSDFRQGPPCVETWARPDRTAAVPELTYFFTAYAYAAMRAVTIAEWFGPGGPHQSEVVLEGFSAGALTTYLVNAVDDRLTSAIAFIAAGDLHTNFSVEGSGLKNAFVGAAGVWGNEPELLEALSLWDPIHYAPEQKAPILMLLGGQDYLFPTVTYQKTFDAIAGVEKRMHVNPTDGHGYDAGLEKSQRKAWYMRHLMGAFDLPVSPEIKVFWGWEKRWLWSWPVSFVFVHPAQPAGAKLTAYGSSTGNLWGPRNDLWVHFAGITSVKTLPSWPVDSSKGVDGWRFGSMDTHVPHVLVQAEHALSGPQGPQGETVPFRTSSITWSARAQSILSLPPDLAACLEHVACMTPEKANFCASAKRLIGP
ncbi:MAG: hypothetical protein HY698_07980 [Deltaproteobacteria bacterium]|nr:hypothetical protein [Deltaproteobacteria bacterium]